ncbi:MAG: hypothetical protein QF803_10925 [Gammaproteobacteria bacterium]|nr:hypothetical protein [Gammaproteobacteria bacterium]
MSEPRTFPYSLHDDHFIVEAGAQRWLLDTGSPVTVGSDPIQLGSLTHEASDNYLGVNIDSLQEMVGVEFDALVGMDVLSQTSLLIDKAEKRVHFGAPAGDGNSPPLTFAAGIPIIELAVNECNTKLFFDTGAKITYLPSRLLGNSRQVRTVDDFYPGLGPFSTPVFRVQATIGDQETEIETGQLPEQLEAMVGLMGVDGILGNSAWHDQDLWFSPGECQIAFDTATEQQSAHPF